MRSPWLVFSTSIAVQPMAPVVGPLAVGAPILVPLGVLANGQLSLLVPAFVPLARLATLRAHGGGDSPRP